MKKRNIKAENERVEKDFPKNPDNISKDELHEHFDLNQDGKVTLEEYAEHIDYHCENPGVLQDELDYERGFKYADGGITPLFDFDDFAEYVNSFYGRGGIYAKDFKGGDGVSMSNIRNAIGMFLFQAGEKGLEVTGDSLDRERVRLILDPEYQMKKGGLTPAKAEKMLKDGMAQGKALTDKQKRYFHAVANEKKMKRGGETPTGESFRKHLKMIKNPKEANKLFVYNPYYKRFGYVNDENLEKGKIPYRVKVHYNKTSEIGKGSLMNINDLIIVDERRYDKGGEVDLFDNYEKLPSKPKSIIDKYMKKYEEGNYNYEDSKEFLKKMEAEGYTFEYGLDNEPYDLRKMEKGGSLKKYAKDKAKEGVLDLIRPNPDAKELEPGEKLPGEVGRTAELNRRSIRENILALRDNPRRFVEEQKSGFHDNKASFYRVVDDKKAKVNKYVSPETQEAVLSVGTRGVLEKGGETPNYDYDYEDIGQFSMKDSNWKYFTQDDFRDIGKEITDTAFNGDVEVAYESIVKQRNAFNKGGMTKSDYLKKKFERKEFVDEDTGELVKIDIPIDHYATRRLKSYSASQERRERKKERKNMKVWEKLQDIKGEIDQLKYELEDEKKYYDSLFVDQDVEAGQKGENWSDDDANRYGAQMNKSLTKITAIKELIKKKQLNYEKIEEEYYS